jgi:hypothetical protein
MNTLKNILATFAQNPAEARARFVWGRNRFLLSFDSGTQEITVINTITWDVVCESSDINQLATAIHENRR